MDLRDYQQRAYEAVLADLAEVQSTLIVCATGTGKTITFAHVADKFTVAGRVLVLAHREELIRQAAEKIGLVTGTTPDIEMGFEWADAPNIHGHRAKIVVSSVQTQIAGRNGKGRMSRFDPADFSLVIIDEAHHAPAVSYKRILAHYQQNPNLKILGVTATPDRTDKLAMGQVFERVSFVYEINDGIDDGWLVPITQRSVTVEGLDFSSVRTTAGDLNGADLAQVMEYEANLHGIAHPTFELSAGRKTLVFAASVAHAERLCEILNRHEPDCARFISGETDPVTRRSTLRDYRRNAFRFLVNCMVFTEGFDEPSIEVVAVARPTKSRALYSQCVGRGTRPLTGVVDSLADAQARRTAIEASPKRTLEVLDFVGVAGRHKLVTCADILGGKFSEEAVAIATEQAKKAGAAVDMRKALEEAAEQIEREKQERILARQREAANRAKLVAKASYSTEVVNAFDVLDIRPSRDHGWNKMNPATEGQIEFLRRQGIHNAAELSKSDAGKLIGEIKRRWDTNECSWKQARLLRKHGYDPRVSKAEATKIIDALAKNGWRRPAEVSHLVGATEGVL